VTGTAVSGPVVERTQVAVVGAGPAGLILARRLALEGIRVVVLERRSRQWVEQRMRAGLLEPATVGILRELGADTRLRAESAEHRDIVFRFDGFSHRLDLEDLTGRVMTTYPQQELVRDLIELGLAEGQDIRFEVADVGLSGVEGSDPVVRFREGDREIELHADFIAGCDGFHGPSRGSIPANTFAGYRGDYPFGWLGILAEAPPSSTTGIYAYHENGFALASLRGPDRSRHYLQVDAGDTLDQWPDERIWDELDTRLESDEAGWTLNRGEIIDRSITPLRSFIGEPMQHGRLFLAGDSAHILPPTGAKGLNLAAADSTTLGHALVSYLRGGSDEGLRTYSRTALRRAWQRVSFSTQMTELTHVLPSADPELRHRLQLARLDYTMISRAAATSLAEGYVGFEFPDAA